MCIEDENFPPAQFLLKRKGRWTSYFKRDTFVRGYHEYKAIWAAAVGEESENQLTSLDILMYGPLFLIGDSSPA